MPKTHVEKTLTIASSAKKVKSIITDFNHWAHWSPWLILEPEVKVTISDDAKKQEWNGKRIGAGMMTIIAEGDSVISYDLRFLKPWKSKAKVDFIIVPESENSTKLTWTMDSTLPFFMFFMKNMMERLIGMDFDRGLLMLKDYAENGSVAAKLEFLGKLEYTGCNFVGIKRECTIDSIGDGMAIDFKKLMAFASENNDVVHDEYFSIYHKYDLYKNVVVYTCCVGVKEPQLNLTPELFNGNIPATKMLAVRHIGPYELSGNAWSAIILMERAKEFKKNKKMDAMEFYRNSPSNTAPENLISDVCIPII